MSTTAAEASLINDVEFLGELEQQEHDSEPRFGSAVYDDAFDALEVGLPMDRGARPDEIPHDERAPIDELPATASEDPAPVEQRISFMAAALVIIMCLSVGAATAALVFHDRVLQISVLRPASR
jgi:hypothetical protein